MSEHLHWPHLPHRAEPPEPPREIRTREFGILGRDKLPTIRDIAFDEVDDVRRELANVNMIGPIGICPACGKPAILVLSLDWFLHMDGTEYQPCLEAMNKGQNRFEARLDFDADGVPSLTYRETP